MLKLVKVGSHNAQFYAASGCLITVHINCNDKTCKHEHEMKKIVRALHRVDTEERRSSYTITKSV